MNISHIGNASEPDPYDQPVKEAIAILCGGVVCTVAQLGGAFFMSRQCLASYENNTFYCAMTVILYATSVMCCVCYLVCALFIPALLHASDYSTMHSRRAIQDREVARLV